MAFNIKRHPAHSIPRQQLYARELRNQLYAVCSQPAVAQQVRKSDLL